MHLDYDEVNAVLRMVRIPDDRIQHLMECDGCRHTVDWERKAANGDLWGEEEDWPTRTMRALALLCRQRGKGMIYAIPALGAVSRLAMLPFFSSMRITIGPLKK